MVELQFLCFREAKFQFLLVKSTFLMVETNRFQLDNSQGPELIDFDLPLHERPGAFCEWVLSKAQGKGKK